MNEALSVYHFLGFLVSALHVLTPLIPETPKSLTEETEAQKDDIMCPRAHRK